MLYLLLLKNEFPESPVVPYYLGSDCVTLSQGMEKINLTSALPGNEPFQIAHTRGKTVMKEAIPLPDEPVNPVGLGFKKR